ncbi:hypothetical protein [Streptomyces naphthomycinicus]|uniref:hypothetical protein n=1 Tax=Streptomyces naphthomycinicus TaxID=2872625 RepID=UPI001CED8716|nr:hypothetical protein [Streptomyces sp. TML10]
MNHAQLIALGRALRLTGEHGQRLENAAATDVSEIRNDLQRALTLVDDAIQTAKPTTRCLDHPSGPVDPDAADLCLLCETRRRAGLRTPPHPRPHHPDDQEAPPLRVPSRHAIRADDPQPVRRWLPELWNGRAWQLCGTPRTSRPEAEQYIDQLFTGPQPAAAYRLVHAYTDHNVVRVWGTPTTVSRTVEL